MWGDIFDSILTGGGIYLWLRFIKRDKNCCFWNSSFGVWDTDNVSVRLAPDHMIRLLQNFPPENFDHVVQIEQLLSWRSQLKGSQGHRPCPAWSCAHIEGRLSKGYFQLAGRTAKIVLTRKCFKKGRHLIKPSLFSFNFVPKSRP